MKIAFKLFVLLLVFSNLSKAQVLTNIKGEPYNEVSYEDVVGNPYLLSDWTTGLVVLENNKNAPASLKLDIYTGELLMRGSNGETLVLKNKLNSFNLNSPSTDISNLNPFVFVKGYPPAGIKQTESTFYQLIGDGKTRLLKYYRKLIDEKREYTSGITSRTFKLSQAYYLFKNNQMIEFQPSKKSILKLLDEHPTQLEAYLKVNNINFRSDVDLQKLFVYYNSL